MMLRYNARPDEDASIVTPSSQLIAGSGLLPNYPYGLATPLQGTLHERELAAGASRSLRWSDVLLPLCMCVRVQEAGWLWSGGFELDSPGDMFVKIR